MHDNCPSGKKQLKLVSYRLTLTPHYGSAWVCLSCGWDDTAKVRPGDSYTEYCAREGFSFWNDDDLDDGEVYGLTETGMLKVIGHLRYAD